MLMQEITAVCVEQAPAYLSLAAGVVLIFTYKKVDATLGKFEKAIGLTEQKVKQASIAFMAMTAPLFVNAQSILTAPMCKIYTQIFDNTFVSALAFIVFTILLVKMLSDEGNGEKSSLMRFAVILSALFNVPKILALLGASPC
jgi:hypothetical protein